MRAPENRLGRHLTGFDALRLVLALAILMFHSVTLTHGSQAAIPAPAAAAAHLILPMFFAMSGFLVAASLSRARSVAEFGLLRFLRLFPGLVITVSLTALVLGPLLSEAGVIGYFSSPSVAAYFGNVAGIPTFGLPGLFPHNPRPDVVNGSLWTIRMELACYLILAPFLLLSRWRGLRPFLLCVAGLALWTLWRFDRAWLGWFNPELAYPFLAGAFLFFLGERMKPDHAAGIAALAFAFWLSASRADAALMALPLAYATVWLGHLPCPRLPGDYAYGLYLAGYPVAQSVLLILPVPDWRLTFAFSAVLALSFAILLWHAVEKPVLAWRRRCLDAEERAPVPAHTAKSLAPLKRYA